MSETDRGFVLVVRPRIGPLTFISAVYGVVFGSLALAPLLAAAQHPTSRSVWAVLGLFTFASFFVAMSVVGIRWLNFGCSILEVCSGEAWVRHPLHPFGNRHLQVSNLECVSIDRHWAAKSYWLYRNAFGVGVNRGPLVLLTPGGQSLHFGGNVSLETAEAIREALVGRVTLGRRRAT